VGPGGRLGEQLQRPVRLAGRQQAAGGGGEGAEDLLGPARLPGRLHQPVGERPGRTGLAAADQDADLGPAQQEQLGHVAFRLGPVCHRLGVGQRPVPLPDLDQPVQAARSHGRRELADPPPPGELDPLAVGGQHAGRPLDGQQGVAEVVVQHGGVASLAPVQGQGERGPQLLQSRRVAEGAAGRAPEAERPGRHL
jgi:hypothetical protein